MCKKLQTDVSISMDIHYMQTQYLVQEIDLITVPGAGEREDQWPHHSTWCRRKGRPVASSQYLVQEKGKTGGLFTL